MCIRDSNWRTHISKKREELKIRVRQMFWLLRAKNKISMDNKRLLYISIIRPIWSYAAVVWSCASDSNILMLQRFQNSILRKFTRAPWHISDEQLHTDLQVGTVKEVINRLTERYIKMLHNHQNAEALQLLLSPNVTRLKRKAIADIG